ncbi:hypothetical protein [Burkholderia gladioli]|uniref:hypothetical protein n=1 Tax=Burkholderia gladioli TaxID=28095 RepID=UPI001640B9A7|nr:hypothetical protein [Burkholderia gladioli]
MPRPKLTDEERAQRHAERLERAREKRAEAAAEREKSKAQIRDEIIRAASVIPDRARNGGVQAVRDWKEKLDAAVHAAELGKISVEKLIAARDELVCASGNN